MAFGTISLWILVTPAVAPTVQSTQKRTPRPNRTQRGQQRRVKKAAIICNQVKTGGITLAV